MLIGFVTELFCAVMSLLSIVSNTMFIVNSFHEVSSGGVWLSKGTEIFTVSRYDLEQFDNARMRQLRKII